MDMISGFLAQSQPKLQSAYSTILTLCDRLKHATHLEDRRSAILALKGLSKEYREAVAEGALRGLINALITDKEDEETVRAALETLLILFLGGVNHNSTGPVRTNNFRSQLNGKYPSPVLMDATVDNFALWLTYQFTEKEENIKALLDLTKSRNTFIRLYTLQLLGAIVANRPSRAQQCISLLKGEDGQQGGVGILVSLLDDNSALVRTECMLVLTSLVQGHTDIQLLVAFEMAFSRLFSIVEQEGGIEGDITVEYALTLVGNLLRYNVMNQNDFRETTDGISQLSSLLDIPQDMEWNEQTIQNTRMLFDIIRILVPPGTEVTKDNQQALFQFNVHSMILKIIFGLNATLMVRADALLTIADMIRSNQENQNIFAQFDVPYVDLNIIGNVQRDPKIIPVVQALLNWSLLGVSVHIFDLRASAALCIEAYFKDNAKGKMVFLEDQTQQFQAAYNFSDESIIVDNENANIFKTLVEFDSSVSMNPYKVWFASTILLHLIEDDGILRDKVVQITFGDESVGGDVVNITAALAEMMARYLDSTEPRIPIAYLMLLIVLLFENKASVDILLSDESAINKLFQFVKQSKGKPLLEAMSAILLGIMYDFGTNSSPISRTDFYNRLISIIGNDRYVLIVRRLKDNSFFRDFDERHMLDAGKDDTGLAEVFFDPVFVSLVKDNFPRIVRALTRTPDMGSSIRVSYDMYQSLETHCGELKDKLEKVNNLFAENEKDFKAKFAKNNENEAELLETVKSLKIDLSKCQEDFKVTSTQIERAQENVKNISTKSDQLQKSLDVKEKELLQMKKKLDDIQKNETALSAQLSSAIDGKDKAEKGINKMSKELFSLVRSKEDCDTTIKNLNKQIQDLTKRISKYAEWEQTAKETIDALKKQNSDLENSILKYKKEEKNFQTALANLEKSKKNISNELSAIKAKYSECTSLNESLKSKLADSAIEMESLASTKELNDKLLDELKAEKINLESQLASLEESVSGLRSLSSAAEKNLVDGQQEFTKHKSSLEAQVNNIEKQLETEKDKTKALNKKVNDLTAEISELTEKLSTAVSTYEGRINRLQENLTKASEESSLLMEKLTSENSALLKQVSLLSQGQESSLVNIQALSSEKSELENQIEALKVSKTALADKNASITKDLEVNKSEFSEKHSLLSAKHKELSTKYEELEFQKAHIADELEKLKAKHEEISVAYRSTEKSLKNELETISADRKSSDSKFEALTIERDQLLIDIDSLKKKLDKAQTKFHKLESISSDEQKAQKKKISQIEENNQSLESRKQYLDGELNTTKEEVINLKLENELLEKNSINAKSDYETSIRNLNDQIKEMVLEQKQLTWRESELNKNMEEKTKEANLLTTKVSDLEIQISDLNAELNEKLEEKSSEVLLLTSQVSNLENLIKDLETEKMTFSASSKASEKKFKTEIKNMSEKFLNAEKELKFSNGKSDEKARAFEIEKTKMNEIIEELTNEKLEIKLDLDKKIQELDNERELLTKDADSTTKDLSNRIGLLEKEKESVQKSLNKKIERLRKENESISAERNDIESSGASIKEMMQDGEALITKLKLEVETLQFDNDKLELSVDELTRQQAQAEKSYKSQVDQLNVDLKKMTAARETLQKKSMKDSKNLQEENQKLIDEKMQISEELAKAERELTEAKKLYADSIKSQSQNTSELKESHSRALAELHEALSSKHAVILSEFESTVATLESKHEDELAESQNKLVSVSAEKEKLDETAYELTSSLKNIQSENKLLNEEVTLLNTRTKELETFLEAETQTVKNVSSDNLRSQKNFETKLEEVTISAKKEKAELESSIEALESQLSEFLGENKALKTEVADAKNSHSIIQELRKSLNVERSSNIRLTTQIPALEASLSTVKLSHEEEMGKLRLEMENLQASFKIIKKERDEFSSRPSKEEFNEVMLMINDLDEKNSKYRSKLEDLGHEFSSDEDDDEDEEDDEDDED